MARHRWSRSTRAGRTTAGMTLVELLAAMAIFLGLAGMVLQVLGGGLDLWATGERTRDESEQATVLLDRLSAELRHLVAADGGEGEPRVKMICDFIALDADGDEARDFQQQRLLFVRSLFEERTQPPLRRAGTASVGTVPFTGTIASQDQRFQATEGLVEEALVPQPDPRPGYEGRMVLWRALRSPIGGPESLFALALKDGGGLNGAELEPLAENVLWFGLAFIDDSVSDLLAIGSAGGPLVLWDSTRGLLNEGDCYAGFRHARGPGSVADADDDVFPSAVRIMVVVAPPPGEAPFAQTVQDLPASGGTMRVDLINGRYLKKLGAQARVLKIGQEWVEAAETDGMSLLITRRGLFGTAASIHLAGTKILVGRRFERTVPLPAARSDLASREDPRSRR